MDVCVAHHWKRYIRREVKAREVNLRIIHLGGLIEANWQALVSEDRERIGQRTNPRRNNCISRVVERTRERAVGVENQENGPVKNMKCITLAG